MTHTSILSAQRAVTIQAGAVVSKVIYRDEVLDVTVFGFDAGEGLTEHQASRAAIVQVLEGRMRFTVDGEEQDARARLLDPHGGGDSTLPRGGRANPDVAHPVPIRRVGMDTAEPASTSRGPPLARRNGSRMEPKRRNESFCLLTRQAQDGTSPPTRSYLRRFPRSRGKPPLARMLAGHGWERRRAVSCARPYPSAACGCFSQFPKEPLRPWTADPIRGGIRVRQHHDGATPVFALVREAEVPGDRAVVAVEQPTRERVLEDPRPMFDGLNVASFIICRRSAGTSCPAKSAS